jgi:predicted Zn-dependent protease
MRSSYLSAGNRLLRLALVCCSLFVLSCSIQEKIPTVADAPIERLVRREAARIIEVSEDKDSVSSYQIFLSDFPRKDILGMSIGHRRIYVSHELAALALNRTWYRWLLRQTLAHEIAHETAGHAKQNESTSFNRAALGPAVTAADIGLPSTVGLRNYSAEKELEADLKGLSYWAKLHWDCQIWVRILQNFQAQNYTGDIFHPTDQRLEQALRVCRPAENDKSHMAGVNLPDGQTAPIFR